MFAISERGRIFRGRLEHLARVNSYYLGYEFDGVAQIFMPRMNGQDERLPVKAAAFWARYICELRMAGACLSLGLIEIPRGKSNVVRGVRGIFAKSGFMFTQSPEEDTVDFSFVEPPHLNNEQVHDLLERLLAEYPDAEINVYLYVYVPNEDGPEAA
jgi:hypothetical protein